MSSAPVPPRSERYPRRTGHTKPTVLSGLQLQQLDKGAYSDNIRKV